jgi:UDP-N-acetyl-D-mannosaminuronate dehydrogenase
MALESLRVKQVNNFLAFLTSTDQLLKHSGGTLNHHNFRVLNNLNNLNTKTYGYDPFLEKKFLKNSKILKYIKNINNFDLIVFLNFHKIFKKIYKKSQKNKVLLNLH